MVARRGSLRDICSCRRPIWARFGLCLVALVALVGSAASQKAAGGKASLMQTPNRLRAVASRTDAAASAQRTRRADMTRMCLAYSEKPAPPSTAQQCENPGADTSMESLAAKCAANFAAQMEAGPPKLPAGLAFGASGQDGFDYSAYCSDPYFGGLPGCCLNTFSPNSDPRCGVCHSTLDCADVSLACAGQYARQQDTAAGFSPTFAARRNTCVYSGDGYGYWSHEPLVFQGSFKAVSVFSLSGVAASESAGEACGRACDVDMACDGIYVSESKRVCFLIAGNHTSLCDMSAPTEANEPPCQPLNVGMQEVPAVGCPTCELRLKDRNGLFCRNNSDECASAREYYYCMQHRGCAQSEQDALAHREICLSGGCSAIQCGLADLQCNPLMLDDCVDAYYRCVADSAAIGSACSCSKAYVECASDTYCLDPQKVSKDLALHEARHIELCNLDGCTAEECGISQVSCNVTAQQCFRTMVECSSSPFNMLSFGFVRDSAERRSVGASEVGIDVQVSDDEMTVTWPKDMGPGVSGAASPIDGSTSAGKWYFEARISGVCAMVGVGTEAFQLHEQAGGRNSWVWTDLGYGGLLMHDSGKPFGPSITEGSTIGIAFDSSTGQIWFAKNGMWMGGNPGTLQDEDTIATDYYKLKPVFGAAADCTSPAPVSITARFSATSFEFQPPVGFASLVQDPCACTEGLRLCLEDSNCMTYEMRETIYEQCTKEKCSKLQCGVSPGIQSTFCLKGESNFCEGAYYSCLDRELGDSGHECVCTKDLLECYQDHGCDMDDDFLTGVASLCMHSGCPAHECGICESRCNSSNVLCHAEFIRCEDNAISLQDHCACAASYYECNEDCMTEEDKSRHLDLCHVMGCKAHECGLSDAVMSCNSSSARCHRELVNCRHASAEWFMLAGPDGCLTFDEMSGDPEGYEFFSWISRGDDCISEMDYNQYMHDLQHLMESYGFEDNEIGYGYDGYSGYSDPPPDTILCPGMAASDYCDCKGDCSGNPDWCACAEAQACCDGSGQGQGNDMSDYAYDGYGSYYDGYGSYYNAYGRYRNMMADHLAALDPKDYECHQNYQTHLLHGRNGLEVCAVPWAGGVAGCYYNNITDTCSHSEALECECTKNYISCLREERCEVPQEMFEDICVQDRCSAEQCGLEPGPVFCQRAEMQCSMEYSQCESLRNLDAITSQTGIDVQQGILCGGQCLPEYFRCIDRAGCAATEVVMQHRDLCIRNGCSAEECGFSQNEEAPTEPDEPGYVTFESMPDARIHVLWNESALAREWSGTGSLNRLNQYMVVLEGSCNIANVPDGILCQQHVQTVNISAMVHEIKFPVPTSFCMDPAAVAACSNEDPYTIGINSEDCYYQGAVHARFVAACSDVPDKESVPSECKRALGWPCSPIVPDIPLDKNGHEVKTYMHVEAPYYSLSVTEMYKVSIYSINAVGRSESPAYTVERLAGVPAAPDTPKISQGSVYSIRIAWKPPTNTGDGTDKLVLTSYTLRIFDDGTTFPDQYPNTFEFPQLTTSFDFKFAVGGKFTKCAELGQTCYCMGIVRLGVGSDWSPPVLSRSYISCAVGEHFPSVAPYKQQHCECNSVGIPRDQPHRAQIGYAPFPLDAGRRVHACVAASNTIGDGPFSICSDKFQVVGVPGKVEFVVSAPSDRYLSVAWSSPADIGVGVGRTEGVSISKYVVVLSTCREFQSSATCEVKKMTHKTAQCDDGCTMEILEEGNLIESTVYYIYVTATNEMGSGHLWEYQRWVWKLRPTIEFPGAGDFPLRAVEWEGKTALWYNDFAQPSVDMFVRDFPLVEISRDCDSKGVCVPQQVTAQVKINDLVFVSHVVVISRQNLTASADFNDPFGIDILTRLTFVAPTVGKDIVGKSTVTFKVTGYTGLEASFDMIYFQYPLPSVGLFSPNQGFTDGGTLIKVEISEPRGAETRAGAGLVSFAKANRNNLQILFGNPNTGDNMPGQIEEVTHQGDVVVIRMRSPDLGAGKVLSPVTFLVAGVPMPISEKVTFQFRTEYLASVVPASGLTIGGMPISMLVIGVTSGSVQSVTATIADNRCTSLTFTYTSSLGQVLITCKTPSAFDLAVGKATIKVQWVDPTAPAASRTVSVESNSLFEYVLLPNLAIEESSITVGSSTAAETVVLTSSPVKVSFTLKYSTSDELIAVSFGDQPATSVTKRGFLNNDIRQSHVIIECFTPTGLTEGRYPIYVSTVSTYYGGREVTSKTLLKFRNLATSSILQTEPSGGRMAGGSVVAASVVSMCRGVCPPPSLAVKLDDVPATFLGAVTLQSWKAKDDGYEKLAGSSEFSKYFYDISPERSAQIADVVHNLDILVADNDAYSATTVFIVFFVTPAAQGSRTETREARITVSCSTSQAGISYTLFADPEGEAVVERVSPSSASVVGGKRVLVSLSNFLIVHRPSDLKIVMGGKVASQEGISIMSSTMSSTTLTFTVPSMAETGVKTTMISPVIMSSNVAVFPFRFSSSKVSQVISVFPEQVYTSGGKAVTAKIKDFGFAGMTKGDVQATIQSPGMDKASTLTSFTAVFDAASQTSTFVFGSYPMPAGLATITLRIQSVNEIAVLYIEYVAAPVGVPQMACQPTTGPRPGGTLVTCFLTNFHEVALSSQLSLQYDNEAANNRIQIMTSSLSLTKVVFLTPGAVSAGMTEIRISAPQYSFSSGSAKFLITDPLQAELLYANPQIGVDENTTEIEIGIGNLKLLFDDPSYLTATATTVAKSGVANANVDIKVTSVRASTFDGTHITLQLGPSPAGIQKLSKRNDIDSISVLIRAGPAEDDAATKSNRFVEFIFQWRAANKAYMETFSPSAYYADGRVPLYMRLSNVLQAITMQDQAYVDFGQGTARAQVTRISSLSGGVVDLWATVPTLTKSIIDGDHISTTPRLVLQAKATEFHFLGPFNYTANPEPRFRSIFPTVAAIGSSTELRLQVRDMPGITGDTGVNQIIVEIAGIKATVLTVEQAAPSLPRTAIQELILRVLAPCCTPEVKVGNAQVHVYHVDYSERVAISSSDGIAFAYYDSLLPFISHVEGDHASVGQKTAFIKFSRGTDVTVHLDNVAQPISTASVEQQGTSISLDYYIASIENLRTDGKAKINIHFYGGLALGPARLNLTLNAGYEESLLLEFEALFYDTGLPLLISVAPVHGSVLSTTWVTAVISKFPVVSSEKDFIVQIGDFDSPDGVFFATNVKIDSSTMQETSLRFSIPSAKEIGTQSVKIIPLGYLESRTVSFDFTFTSATTSVSSVSRASVASTGGDLVVLSIDFFHPISSSREVVVTLSDDTAKSDQTLSEDRVKIRSSTAELTQLEITFPPTSPSPAKTVTIVPRALGLGSAATFKIQVKDPAMIDWTSPVPKEACQRKAGEIYRLFVTGVPAAASASQITVRYNSASNFPVTGVRFNAETAITAIDFSITAIYINTPGAILEVTYGSNTISTPFAFVNCDETNVESVSPSAALSSGGSRVVLYVRKLSPYSSNLPLIVTFGEIETTASVIIVEGTASNVVRARVEFQVPSVPFAWTVTGTLQQLGGLALSFPFSFEAPCNYVELCAENAFVVNSIMLSLDPPSSAVCDPNYCVAPEDLPSPFLLSVQPSTAVTTGGTIVTAVLSAFPAVQSVADLQIRVGGDEDFYLARPISFTVLQDGGSGGLESKASLEFEAPKAPHGSGFTTVDVSVSFGLRQVHVGFEILYVSPILGPIQVLQYSPKSTLSGADSHFSQITVQLTNAPIIQGNLNDDVTKAKLQLAVKNSQGATTFSSGALRIQESTHDFIKAVFPLPPSMSAGSYKFHFNHASNNADRAGIVDFVVTALGDPEFASIVPKSLTIGRTTWLSISVRNFPINPQNLKVELLYEGSQTWSSARNAPVDQTNSADCVSRSCNSAILKVSAIATGAAGTAQIRVCSDGFACASSTIEIVTAGQTIVSNVNPNAGPAFGKPHKVTIYVSNFPSTLPGGALITQDQVRVKVDGVFYSVTKWIQGSSASDPSGAQPPVVKPDQIEFYMPAALQALRLEGKVSNDLEGMVYAAGDVRPQYVGRFTYRALRPQPSLSPVDASSAGGSGVTVRVYWGFAINSYEVTVSFGEIDAQIQGVKNFLNDVEVLETASIVHYSDISVITPALAQLGMIDVTVRGSFSETIPFEVFKAPTIRAVLPSRATLRGGTVECDECLVHKKNSISLWVDGFPDISLASELRVQIGSVVCDGESCSILSVKSLATGLLYVAVSVPPSSTAGPASVKVSLVGDGPLPTGMAIGDGYVRSARIAVSGEGMFSYFEVKPAVVRSLFCKTCVLDPATPCVSDGNKCSDGSIARQSSGADALMPERGGGVLTLMLSDVGIIDKSLPVQVDIGASTASASVITSTRSLTVLELVAPRFVTAGAKSGRIVITPAIALSFSALVYDDTITATCVSLDPPYSPIECSSAGGTPVTLQLANFNIGRPADLYKTIAVYFGAEQAGQVTWVCCADLSKLIIRVDAPAHTAEELMSMFTRGRADLDLKVELLADASIFALTTFTIWAPPKILSAYFDSYGTVISIIFDQPTNTKVLSKEAGSCDSIISASKFLGTGASCMWQAADELTVSLGAFAEIAVGHSISILTSANVRSRNGISSAMDSLTSSVEIEQPRALIVPGPVSVIAPSSVDPCSGVELSYSVPSPRSLDYFWSCENNEKLDDFLRARNRPLIRLAQSTPELEFEDFTYVIHVFATDFLGVSTPIETIRLTKSGVPGLMTSILGKAQYLSTQDVVIKGSAAFSQCAGTATGNLLFNWELTEPGSLITSTFALTADQRSKSQLYFAPTVLTGGRRYKAAVTVSNEADPSQTSSSIFEVVVVSPPLVATISGGASFSVSQFTFLKLDASASFDPQLGRIDDPELRFQWTCTLRILDQEMPCLDQRAGRSEIDLSQARSTVTLSPRMLAVSSSNSVYIFTVVVSKDIRTSTATTRVTILEENVPTALIFSPSITVLDEDTGYAKVNPDTRLQLYMDPSMQNPSYRYTWSVASEVGDSALMQSGSVPMGFDKDTFVLVPPADIFVPGFSYSISLTVSQGSRSGFNSLMLVINKPPSSGVCEVCNLDVGTGCSTSGVALLDTFRITCRNWADEDLPLSYSFGMEMSGGDLVSFSPMTAPFLDQLLPSGAVAATAQVIDSLGGTTSVQRMSISLRTGRRLLSWADGVENALTEAGLARDSGDAGRVNSLVHSIALSLESASNSYSKADRRSKRATLEQLVDTSMASAAPTVDYAVETLAAAQRAANGGQCELSDAAVQSLIRIVDTQTTTNTDFVPFPAAFGQNLASVLGHVSTALSTEATCGAEISTTQIHDFLRIRHDGAARAMAGFVQTNVVGEPQSVFSADNAALAVERLALAQATGVLKPGDARAGQFFSAGGFQSPALTRSYYDFMTAEGRLPRNPGSLFSTTILSHSSASLAILDSTSKQQVNVSQLSNPVTVRLVIDKELISAGGNWKYGASCAYYVPASPGGEGALSFDGCTPTKRDEEFIECACTHLTEFIAAIDPDIANCGDGVLQAGEACDDGNTFDKDGCSPGCEIEAGATCWQTESGLSRCCAPCSPGSYRDSCILFSEVEGTSGSCLLCPVNSYKPDLGRWDTQCRDCPPGLQSGRGATSCSAEAPCSPGYYRPSQGQACQTCPAGTFKPISGSSTDQCTALQPCPPGRQLEGYTSTSKGTCELCPASTYKEVIGTWSSRCIPCPTGSSTTSTGNDLRSGCVCGTGFEASSDSPPAFCDDINECTTGICAGENIVCINTPGSYQCIQGANCGDGFVTGSEPCDDTNLVNSDGCSSLCTIEAGYQCTNMPAMPSVCSCDSTHFTPPNGPGCSLFCSPERNCNGHGTCAKDPSAGGVGAGGGYCQCARFYFEVNCATKLDPKYSLEYVVSDTTVSHKLTSSGFDQVAMPGFSLVIPPYALDAPVTIAVDGFAWRDLPQSMQAPARRYKSFRIISDVITLNPDGTKVKDAILTLSHDPVTDLKEYERIELFTFNQETALWEPARQSRNGTGVVMATLDHFSAYVTVVSQYGEPVVVPEPTPAPTPKATQRGVSGGAIAAAVLVPLAVLAAAAAYFYSKREKKPTKDGPLLSSTVGFDETAVDYAETQPVSPEKPLPTDEDLLSQPLVLPGLDDTWVPCRGCQNPVKLSWPHCPSCRAKTPQGVAGAAVTRSLEVEEARLAQVSPSITDAGEGSELLSDQEKSVLQDDAQPAADPLSDQEKAGLESSTSAGAGVGELNDDYLQTFTECYQCSRPVKFDWPRCPGCKAPVKKPAATPPTDDAPEPPSLITAVVEPVPQIPPSALALDASALGFTAICYRCQAPVKPSWSSCPGCKAKVLQPGESPPAEEGAGTQLGALQPASPAASFGAVPIRTEDFTLLCANQDCGAPVKQMWKRCPTCKTPIAGAKGEGEDKQTKKEKKRSLSSLKPLPPSDPGTSQGLEQPVAAAADPQQDTVTLLQPEQVPQTEESRIERLPPVDDARYSPRKAIAPLSLPGLLPDEEEQQQRGGTAEAQSAGAQEKEKLPPIPGALESPSGSPKGKEEAAGAEKQGKGEEGSALDTAAVGGLQADESVSQSEIGSPQFGATSPEFGATSPGYGAASGSYEVPPMNDSPQREP